MTRTEEIEHLILQIASMIKTRDDRAYTGKYSDLNYDIFRKKMELQRILNELR